MPVIGTAHGSGIYDTDERLAGLFGKNGFKRAVILEKCGEAGKCLDIGGILILSGCFMYGLSYSQRLKNRIIILKDMVRMLSVMNNHIGYSLIDMTQIFERLGDFDMCSYVRNFTGYIYEALNKSDIDTFALIWNEAADKAFAGILGKRQLEIIKEAGSISTFIDKDSQLKHIQSVVCELNENLMWLRLMQQER